MKIKLSVVVMLATIVSGPSRAALLSDAEATFLDQLVTASVVLEQRCDGYEVDGSGGVRLGARLLGSPEAAMAMIERLCRRHQRPRRRELRSRQIPSRGVGCGQQDVQARPDRSDQKPEESVRRLWRCQRGSGPAEAVLSGCWLPMASRSARQLEPLSRR